MFCKWGRPFSCCTTEGNGKFLFTTLTTSLCTQCKTNSNIRNGSMCVPIRKVNDLQGSIRFHKTNVILGSASHSYLSSPLPPSVYKHIIRHAGFTNTWAETVVRRHTEYLILTFPIDTRFYLQLQWIRCKNYSGIRD